MKLTEGEKYILRLLAQIQEKLDIGHPELVTWAVESGNTWALNYRHGNEKEPDVDLLPEINKILWMWDCIDHSLKQLSEGEKTRIETELNGWIPSYLGFSSMYEKEADSIAYTLIKFFGFDGLKSKISNDPHSPILHRYRRMYEIFHPIKLELKNKLSTDTLIELGKAIEVKEHSLD